MFNAPPYNTGDDLLHVNFFTGPWGINRALQDHSGETNAVLSSGWGAANASLLLMKLQFQKDPALPQTLFILDNNVARPDGGFGTRYPWFALIGVNPIPSPTDTDALGVVDVGYEYDYNSNAPADVLNPVAAVNSLVAYLNGTSTRMTWTCRSTPTGPLGHVRHRQHMRHHRQRCRPRVSRRAVRHRSGRRPRRGIRHGARKHHLRHLHKRRSAADQFDP